MYDFSDTSHIEPMRPEHDWKEFKKDKRISVTENHKAAPKGLPPKVFQEKLRAWDKATVHRMH
jgi:hypothetical protein